ncbi:MAG: desulfoferrodoxin family protein [Deltaproteobacteria bacterium]|nr:desulfoferrodoxin family protein [Deltaproteobacteria bacterium]
MNRRRFCYLMVLGGLSLYTQPAFANKASTSIDAPQTATKGSEITIRVTVTHKGNSFLHYTKWLRVIANQKEIARWDYSSGQRPEAEVFTREVKTTAIEDLEVTAEAHCNIHGSTGPATVKISVKE